MSPQPAAVTPLVRDLGTTDGQQVVLLSFEHYDEWTDLRFARIDVGADRPIARRVPAVEAWSVSADGSSHEVVDAVGRGDRTFSNGEVRVVPALRPGTQVTISVEVAPGSDRLEATVTA